MGKTSIRFENLKLSLFDVAENLFNNLNKNDAISFLEENKFLLIDQGLKQTINTKCKNSQKVLINSTK